MHGSLVGNAMALLRDGMDRQRVPGGWIYRSRRVTIGTNQPPDAVVFVPDEQGDEKRAADRQLDHIRTILSHER